jgi:D-alanine-D-alanine ligase-like ATP-grasp enzyme
MTSTSLLPKAAISYGINYSDLVEKIIKLAG